MNEKNNGISLFGSPGHQFESALDSGEGRSLQKLIMAVRFLNLPENVCRYRLAGKSGTNYEGLRDLELIPLDSVFNITPEELKRLRKDMLVGEKEILVIADKNGMKHLAKVGNSEGLLEVINASAKKAMIDSRIEFAKAMTMLDAREDFRQRKSKKR